MEQFFQFKHTDTAMCFNQLTFIHCKLLYANRQYTSSGILYPKCYHVCRGHRSWLLSEATVAHLGLHQFQYCRQNHETLRLPAECRRSVVHTKHATFVLRLFWTTVLPKRNRCNRPRLYPGLNRPRLGYTAGILWPKQRGMNWLRPVYTPKTTIYPYDQWG